MGVTIHFDGQLLDERAFRGLLGTVTAFANERAWKTESIDSEMVTLLRVRDEEDCDYRGPVKGIAVYPAEDCDPVRLEFDSDLYVQEYTKTQFAGIETHLQVLSLLTALRPFFRDLRVEDEGEYWETQDVQVLSEHMNRIQQVIDEELRNNPAVRTKVKTPEGRIMDLIS